jgi:hypothetical protein
MRPTPRTATLRLLLCSLLAAPFLSGCFIPFPYKCSTKREILAIRPGSGTTNPVETLTHKITYLDSYVLLGADADTGTIKKDIKHTFYLEGTNQHPVKVKSLNALKPDYQTIYRWTLKPIASTNLWVAIKLNPGGKVATNTICTHIDTFLFDAKKAFGNKRLDSYQHFNTGNNRGSNYILDQGNRRLIYRAREGCACYDLLDGTTVAVEDPPEDHPLFP